MNKTYISGKTTGEELMKTWLVFKAAERKLKLMGHKPVNPMGFRSSTETDKEFMRKRIKEMMNCETIYMLGNWKESKEARLEHFIALKLGMKIIKEK